MQQENYQKYFPDDFTLETPRVQLRLLKPEDVHALKMLTKNADIPAMEIFRFMINGLK